MRRPGAQTPVLECFPISFGRKQFKLYLEYYYKFILCVDSHVPVPRCCLSRASRQAVWAQAARRSGRRRSGECNARHVGARSARRCARARPPRLVRRARPRLLCPLSWPWWWRGRHHCRLPISPPNPEATPARTHAPPRCPPAAVGASARGSVDRCPRGLGGAPPALPEPARRRHDHVARTPPGRQPPPIPVHRRCRLRCRGPVRCRCNHCRRCRRTVGPRCVGFLAAASVRDPPPPSRLGWSELRGCGRRRCWQRGRFCGRSLWLSPPRGGVAAAASAGWLTRSPPVRASQPLPCGFPSLLFGQVTSPTVRGKPAGSRLC